MARLPIFLVLAGLVFCLAAPAAARSEIQVSPPRIGPAFGAQDPVSIAFHEGQGFIIWSDWRAGSSSAVYGSRVNADGALLDPAGIRLSDFSAFNPSSPQAVVWGGDAWIVIYGDGGIRGRRIDRNGQLLGSPVLLVNRAPGLVRAASNGSTLFVTSAGSQDHTAIVANRDLSGIRVVDMTLIRGFEVISDGDDYVVFGYLPYLYGGRTVQAARFTSRGETAGQKDSGVPEPFAAATLSGDSFFIAAQQEAANRAEAPTGLKVWQFTRNLEIIGEPRLLTDARAVGISLTPDRRDGALAIWSVQFSASYGLTTWGARTGSNPTEPVRLHERRWLPWLTSPSVPAAHDGGHFFIATPELAVVRIADNVLQPDILKNVPEEAISRAAQLRFMPARGAPSDLYVFAEEDGAVSRVMIGRHGTPARVLHESSTSQYAPSIATNGRSSVVTWIEGNVPNEGKVVALFLDAAERPLRASAVLGTTYHRTDYWNGHDQRMWPAGAIWSGSMYLIAWGGSMARALDDGSIIGIDAAPISDHVALARLGDMIVAVSMTYDSLRPCMLECFYAEVVAQRFTLHGVPFYPSVRTLTPFNGGLPQIAVNGDTALIVTDGGGTVLMKSDGSVTTPAFHGRSLTRPTVVAHGEGFLLAWQDFWRNGPIRGATMSKDGVLFPSFLIATDVPLHTPQAWTTAEGKTAVTYLRVNEDTEWVPRLYTTIFEVEPVGRRRSVRK